MSHEETTVDEIPDCQFPHPDDGALAEYDAKTKAGPWAYMCATHFRQYGIGLGIGRGQKLVLRRPAEGKVTP